MTITEIITLSEITGESIAAIEGAVSDISATLVTRLQAEIVKWDAEHDGVDFQFNGEGVSLEGQSLLDAITERVRLWLGFEPLNSFPSLPGSVVITSSLGW
jgi:hypothetical protein